MVFLHQERNPTKKGLVIPMQSDAEGEVQPTIADEGEPS